MGVDCPHVLPNQLLTFFKKKKTYNAASGCECEMESLDEWPAFPEREWLDFTPNEVQVTLAACAKNSALGLDHIIWSYLKLLLTDMETCVKVVDLANACFEHGHWPTFFKESSLVIIPKLGKPSYSVPKVFRPIVLLNTMGKLIKKCVLNRIQFDCVKHGVFQSNQFGEIMQRSTEDAGLYLTHLVKAGWARGLKTSMIAFDIVQFFPSLNHGMLMAILRQSGFPEKAIHFFSSYLVNRETSYHWGEFSSPKMNAHVGVGQGLALSSLPCTLHLYWQYSTSGLPTSMSPSSLMWTTAHLLSSLKAGTQTCMSLGKHMVLCSTFSPSLALF
jgi:hypothetical protein